MVVQHYTEVRSSIITSTSRILSAEKMLMLGVYFFAGKETCTGVFVDTHMS